jgi:hypothetical protein
MGKPELQPEKQTPQSVEYDFTHAIGVAKNERLQETRRINSWMSKKVSKVKAWFEKEFSVFRAKKAAGMRSVGDSFANERQSLLRTHKRQLQALERRQKVEEEKVDEKFLEAEKELREQRTKKLVPIEKEFNDSLAEAAYRERRRVERAERLKSDLLEGLGEETQESE